MKKSLKKIIAVASVITFCTIGMYTYNKINVNAQVVNNTKIHKSTTIKKDKSKIDNLSTKNKTLDNAKQTQEKAKEEISKPHYTSAIVFENTVLNVGELTYTSIYDENSLRATQNYINQGNIAKGFHSLDVNDGLMSYAAGHNPGVMAPMAAYAGVNKTFEVWDENGNHRTYRFDHDEMLQMGARADNRMIDLLSNQINQQEGIIIQFCQPEINQRHFWVAYPVN